MNCRRISSLPQKSESGSTEARTFPAWQLERANRLHRKFLSVEAAMNRGVRFNDAVKHFVWYHRGNHFVTDPARKVLFSRGTLRSRLIHWRKNGRTPDCLFLHYTAGRGPMPPRLLCRFVDYCRQTRHLSLRTALKAFGRELTASERAHLNYNAMIRYFTGGQFRKIQSAIRAADRDHRRADRIASEAQARIIQLRRWYER